MDAVDEVTRGVLGFGQPCRHGTPAGGVAVCRRLHAQRFVGPLEVVDVAPLGEVTLRDWWRVMGREVQAGLSLGAILGTILKDTLQEMV